MKLLVTGGAGFIGSNFIHYILAKYSDYQIVNLDLLTYAGNLENLESVQDDPRYAFVKGDIADQRLLDELFAREKFDVVVHFAAESHVDRSILDPDVFININIIGTHCLLKAALENNVHFHHVSTDEVFGSLSLSDLPFNEKTPYAPSSPYSASKASSDHLVRVYHQTFGLPITITNCSNNYGPYQFPEKLIPLFITNLMEDKKVLLYGDGLNVRDWLFVEDHCRAIDLVLHRGTIGGTYCVGGDSEKNNKEITYKILELMGHDETMIDFVADRRGHDRRYAIDFSKLKNELGWRPQVSFEEGIQKTLDWYQTNQAWWKKLKNSQAICGFPNDSL